MPGCWERNEFFFFKEIIYFWLFCVFVAAHGLSLFAATGGYSLVGVHWLLMQWLLSLHSTGFRACGLSGCSSQALEYLGFSSCRLSSCGIWVFVDPWRKDFSQTRDWTHVPCRAGWFLTPGSSEKSKRWIVIPSFQARLTLREVFFSGESNIGWKSQSCQMGRRGVCMGGQGSLLGFLCDISPKVRGDGPVTGLVREEGRDPGVKASMDCRAGWVGEVLWGWINQGLILGLTKLKKSISRRFQELKMQEGKPLSEHESQCKSKDGHEVRGPLCRLFPPLAVLS